MSKRSDCPLILRVERNKKTGIWGHVYGSPMLVTPTEIRMVRSILKGRRVNDSPEGPKLADAGKRLNEMEGQLRLDRVRRRRMTRGELLDELKRETYVQQILQEMGLRDRYLEKVIGETKQLIKKKEKDNHDG